MIKAIRRHPWVMRAAVTSIVIGAIGVGVVLAEDLWVNNVYVELHQGPMGAFPVVPGVRVKQGEKLTVMERQDDWIHVKYNNVDGWVQESDLADKPVGASSMAAFADSSSSGAGNAQAAKGFDEHEFAVAKNYKEEPFKNWMAMYDVSSPTTLVKPGDVKKFMAAGHVGPVKS
ncbi:MAG TPA: SH3 domain-containing protein, partial [Tepidisphaeraceae bacterium]|nr:SH3 domain-containing protein [Tepidisphaeraceae bacterium]